MPYLIVERAGVIVERRKLDKDQLSIGRAQDSDVVLDDPQIGSRLAVLKRGDDGYVLEDLGSMAGITHQNERVATLDLRDGMRFEAFPFTFLFEDEGGPGSSGDENRMEATMAMDMSAPGEGAELVSVNGRFGPFQLKAGVNVVGRKEGVEIHVDDRMVSKEHAIIIALPGEFVVEDKGSVNGTFVNRKKITRAPLRDGDLIQFGGIEFKLVVASSDEDHVPAAGETQDIPLDGLLLGGALEQQAQALKSSAPVSKKSRAKAKSEAAASTAAPKATPKKAGGGKGLRLALVGCLLIVVVVGVVAVLLLGGGGAPPPPPVDNTAQLKLDQAKAILQSDDNFDTGLTLVEEVLASQAPDDVKASAKTLKDQLQEALRRPTPIEKMTPAQLLDAANELVAKGSLLESVRYWERLVSLDPVWQDCGKSYSTLMYQIGLIYDGAGKRDLAVQVWKRALWVIPDAPPENTAHAKIRSRLRALGVSL